MLSYQYMEEKIIKFGRCAAYFRKSSSKLRSKQIAMATRPKSVSKTGASLPQRIFPSVVSAGTR